jgi:hypothetical protein
MLQPNDGKSAPVEAETVVMTDPPKPARSRAERVAWVFVFAVFAGLLWSALPAFQQRRNSGRSPCQYNLKHIGLALHNYHDVHGTFPPAITYGADGKPWHSWRVILLPYLDQQELFERYRFDEPWNGPHNRLLANALGESSVFHCPTDDDTPRENTSYVAVIGEDTMWSPGGVSLNDVTDDENLTLQIVEVSDSGVLWMAPRDLRLDAMSFEIGAKKGVGIRSRHEYDDRTVANVSLVSGAVRAFDETTPPAELRSMLIRNDGKPTED